MKPINSYIIIAKYKKNKIYVGRSISLSHPSNHKLELVWASADFNQCKWYLQSFTWNITKLFLVKQTEIWLSKINVTEGENSFKARF